MKVSVAIKKEFLQFFKEDLLPVGQLEIVWPDAQQPFVAKHGDGIAEDWSWELLGTIIVCGPFKNGKFHIIDGQHRVYAVQKLFGPKETVPCHVYATLDKTHAAWVFRKINVGRRKPKLIDIFKTAVTANSEPEVTIARVVRAIGFNVGPGGITGVSALAMVHKLGGDKLLSRMLLAIKDTWGVDEAKRADATIIRIFAGFIHAYKDASLLRLQASIAKQFTVGRFLGTVKSVASFQRISSTQAGIDLLVRTYDTGLRAGKLGNANRKD